MTHNGYANYETWELCLELDNDQGLQEAAMEAARRFYLDHGGEEDDDGNLILPLDDDAIYKAASDMEAWVDDLLEEIYPDILGSRAGYKFLISTAIITFLGEVDWEEVVEKFLEE